MRLESKKQSTLMPGWVLFCFILAKLALSLYPLEYGIFRDEFYYLSMSNRLGLGYVDVPPLAPLFLAGIRSVFGDSYFSLHLLPALSGVAFLLLAYLLVKKMGGNSFAQFLTLTAVLFAPYFTAIDSIYSYDTYSKLFWLLFSYLMIRLIQTDKPKYWLLIGIVAGIGILFKITILYLGFCWILGLLLTSKRRLLFKQEVLWATLLVLIIVSPYLIWQIQHHFVTLDYMKNYSGKISDFSILRYFSDQKDMLNPVTLPLWLAGLFYLLFHFRAAGWRPAGITYIFLFAFSFLMKAKPDFIMPFYVLLIAAGCIWLGNGLNNKSLGWIRGTISLLIILVGVYALPVARPVIPVKTFIQYFGKMTTGSNTERNSLDKLPQFYADRFGWQELTAKVAKVYRSLPKEERAKACILASNYGEAGAIEYYGKKYGLPLPVVSGHNQYHVWGPGRYSGDVVISVGISMGYLMEGFEDVRPSARFTNQYAMPYERENPICVCRHPHKKFPKIKPWLKWLG